MSIALLIHLEMVVGIESDRDMLYPTYKGNALW